MLKEGCVIRRIDAALCWTCTEVVFAGSLLPALGGINLYSKTRRTWRGEMNVVVVDVFATLPRFSHVGFPGLTMLMVRSSLFSSV